MLNSKWLYFVFKWAIVHTIHDSKGQISDYANCCKMSCICDWTIPIMPIWFSKLIHFCKFFSLSFIAKENWSSEKFRIVHWTLQTEQRKELQNELVFMSLRLQLKITYREIYCWLLWLNRCHSCIFHQYTVSWEWHKLPQRLHITKSIQNDDDHNNEYNGNISQRCNIFFLPENCYFLCQHRVDWLVSMWWTLFFLFITIWYHFDSLKLCYTHYTTHAPLFWWFFSLAFRSNQHLDAIQQQLRQHHSAIQIKKKKNGKNKAIYLIVKCARAKINVFNEFHNHGHKSRIAKQNLPQGTTIYTLYMNE